MTHPLDACQLLDKLEFGAQKKDALTASWKTYIIEITLDFWDFFTSRPSRVISLNSWVPSMVNLAFYRFRCFPFKVLCSHHSLHSVCISLQREALMCGDFSSIKEIISWLGLLHFITQQLHSFFSYTLFFYCEIWISMSGWYLCFFWMFADPCWVLFV